MGLFVGRVELHEVVPAAESAEQVGAELVDPPPRPVRPLLVEVLGQQVARAAVGRGSQERLVSGAEGLVRGGLEKRDVDRDGLVGEQGDRLAAQDDGVVSGRSAGEVGGLVQPGRGLVDGEVGPQGVDHLLAVHPSSWAQREELDERGGVPPAPGAGGDGGSVSAHLEGPQQRDLDRHRCPRSSRCPETLPPTGAAEPAASSAGDGRGRIEREEVVDLVDHGRAE